MIPVQLVACGGGGVSRWDGEMENKKNEMCCFFFELSKSINRTKIEKVRFIASFWCGLCLVVIDSRFNYRATGFW